MPDNDADLITHLLEVENEAASVIMKARKKADEISLSAKSEYEKKFREASASIKETSRKKEEEEKLLIKNSREEEIEAYRKSLSEAKRNRSSFVKLLDRVLFE